MNQAIEKFRNWLEEEINNLSEIIKKEVKEKFQQILLNSAVIKDFNKKSIREKIYNDLINKNEQNDTLEKIQKMDYILSILMDEESKFITDTVLFNDFGLLCELLSKSSLNAKERVNIVLLFLKKDMRDFFDECFLINYEEIKDLKMPSMTEKEFKEFVQGKEFLALVEKNFEELTEEEKDFKLQLRKKITEKQLSNNLLIGLKSIQRHYFDKKNYNQKDILIVAKAMELVGVSSTICFSFQKIMNATIKEPKKENQTLKPIPKKLVYDYKVLEKSVSDAVDLRDMKPKRYLSLEEKIYYLSILIRMNVLKEERKLFLRNCEITYEEVSPLREYLENLNRLQYYEESVGLQKENVFMEECFKEMFLCSHEDYCFWKQNLEETLKQVNHWIPKNYEYEEKEASRLLHKIDMNPKSWTIY